MITITRTDTDTKARYVARHEGIDAEAELTLSKLNPGMIIVDHTGVPDALRGKGMGQALAARVVADARAAGQRIVPLCPFFKAQAQKHAAEWADVVTL